MLREMTIMDTASRIIAAVRARSNDATVLRDAAHEAHHALDAKASTWSRASIHRALMRKHTNRVDILSSEVMARAVEQIVCADLGVECRTIDVLALVACMESIKHGLPHVDPKTFASMVRSAMAHAPARKAADAVIALAGLA